MRRSLVTFGALLVLAAFAFPRDAQALRLRLGGHSVVDPETDTKFAIGLDNDMRFIPFLGLNYGFLWSVDGDSMYSDLYLGIKLFFPVAMEDKLEATLRGNFLIKHFYPWDDPNAEEGAFALGGVVGPGVSYNFGPASVSFELDVQIYSFLWPEVYDTGETYVSLAYVFGVGF